MNKRIASLAIVFAMLWSMLVSVLPVHVHAAPPVFESTQLKITANTTTAKPGDTITFTITMGPVSDLGTMQMVTKIPDGLSYVDNSGKLADGLKETLGFDILDWTEENDRPYAGEFPGCMINGVASAADYYSDTDTVLATFDCTVDEGASGVLQLGLYNLEFYSCQGEWPDHTDRFSVVPATITVTGGTDIPAESVTIDKESITLTVGASETLTATVRPEGSTDTVVWSSDDPGIATVEPATGKVTAVSAGNTTITATAGERKDTCAVEVQPAGCAHSDKETVPAKESNCTEKGWDEYQKCRDCGALFSKEGAPIADVPYRELNENHVWADEWSSDETGHWRVCTLNPEHLETVTEHTPDRDAPTETDPVKCTVCDYVIDEATGHVCASHLEKVERKEAKCTEDGNIEHYRCTSCGNLFEDAGALVPTDAESVKLEALGHDWAEANCTDPKTCNRCDITEGEALGHDWAGAWSSDATNHWHDCTRCDETDGMAAHEPDRDAPTETDPVKCTVCDYVIDEATGHICADHLTKVDRKEAKCTEDGNIEHYRCTSCGNLFEDASALVPTDTESVKLEALGHDWKEADCTDPKTCNRCFATEGEALGHDWKEATCTTPKTCDRCQTTDGDALGHDWSRVWSSDETHHWNDCSRCDEKDNYEEHNPDRDHPTYEHPVLCEDCGYVIEEQLEEQTVRIELPFTLRVENTGDREPGREVFTFIAENFGEVVEYEVVSNTVETNGTNVYDGKFVIAVKEGDVSRLYEGFEFRQVKGTSNGWTYDETKYYVMLEPIINFAAEGRAAYYWRVFGFGRDGQPDYDTPINGVSFVNSYKYKAPAAPAEPARPNPNTGVKGGHAMGMVLFLAGTAAAGIALSGKKDK